MEVSICGPMQPWFQHSRLQCEAMSDLVNPVKCDQSLADAVTEFVMKLSNVGCSPGNTFHS